MLATHRLGPAAPWRPWIVACLYSALIAYGSLIPLEFETLSYEQAWTEFQQIPYLEIGPATRADWVANLALFVPIGLFWAAALAGGRGTSGRILLGGVALALSASLAVGIEFTQVFLPRTVSQNDLIAEFLGAGLGVALWIGCGPWLVSLYQHARSNTAFSLYAALVLYLVGYVAFCLAPFDFVLSADELSRKVTGGHMSWWTLGEQTAGLRGLAVLTLEILAVVPVGLLAVLVTGRTSARSAVPFALLVGGAFGLSLEILQVFTVSGRSQGASVLARAVGAALGGAVPTLATRFDPEAVRPYLRPAAVAVTPIYLLAAAALCGWRPDTPLGPAEVREALGEVWFLPFYYHYRTSESIALRSVLLNAVLYMPVGGILWAWWGTRSQPSKVKLWIAAGSGALTALAMESGRLIWGHLRPDPTNVLIAAVAAPLGYLTSDRALQWLRQVASGRARTAPLQGFSSRAVPSASSGPSSPILAAHSRSWPLAFLWRALSLACLLLAAAITLRYPLARGWLALAAAAYAGVLFRWPRLWLIVLPALLATLDLSPWSGWFFVDEFDVFVLTTLAVGYWRLPVSLHPAEPGRGTTMAVAVLAASYVASVAVALLPLPPLDPNSFASYFGRYNALRVGKAFLWALALFPLVRRGPARDADDFRRFALGMQLGLFAVGIWVAVERFLFAGLFDFSHEFRVTGPFFTMHTGGQHLDAYLAMAIPFVFVRTLGQRRLAFAVWSTGLLVLGLHAVLATMSRGVLVAVAMTTMALGMDCAIRFRPRSLPWGRLLAWSSGLLLVALLVVVPAVKSDFLKARLAKSGNDLLVRVDHWRRAVGFMPADLPSRLFGMGLGSYPRVFAANVDPPRRPGRYEYRRDNGEPYLRLYGGADIYFQQQIDLEPHRAYRLEVDLRSSCDGAAIGFPICEKNALYSFRCTSARAHLRQADGQWEHHTLAVDAGDVGAPAGRHLGSLSRRPVSFAMVPRRNTAWVDVDNVQLLDSQGRNLLDNGGFSRGNDFWFFTADAHRPWHIFNVMVHVFFEQGLLGLGAMSLLLLLVGAKLWRLFRRGDQRAAVLAASMTGFLLVGLFGSLLDAPRVALLFYWLALTILALTTRSAPYPTNAGTCHT